MIGGVHLIQNTLATQRNTINSPETKEWLVASTLRYLAIAPFSLCIRELNRLLAIRELVFAGSPASTDPILDVGCGDGFWWQMMPSIKNVYGIDISKQEIKTAANTIKAKLSDISAERPFPEISFNKIIGNCSLEHVRNISEALVNLRSSVSKDGTLILFVPSPNWAYQGKLLGFLLRKCPRIAMMISGALNGFFQHWHLYELPVWNGLLQKSGWKVTESFGLGNRRSEFLFRLFLPLSLPSFIFKSIFRFYPNRILSVLPSLIRRPFVKLMLWALENPIVDVGDPKAYEFVIIAKPTGISK